MVIAEESKLFILKVQLMYLYLKIVWFGTVNMLPLVYTLEVLLVRQPNSKNSRTWYERCVYKHFKKPSILFKNATCLEIIRI